jgi:hypothetical protein
VIPELPKSIKKVGGLWAHDVVDKVMPRFASGTITWEESVVFCEELKKDCQRDWNHQSLSIIDSFDLKF